MRTRGATTFPTGSFPAIYGHRGSRRPGPENTVEGVEQALSSGASGVEVDVRSYPLDVHRQPGYGRDLGLGDVELVLSHDPVRGQPPRLVDVLDVAAGRGRVICEVKNRPGQADFDAPRCSTARALVALLAARDHGRSETGAADDVVISSFDWCSLALVRELGGPPTAFLTPPGVALRAAVSHAVDHGHAEVHPHWSAANERAVASAHEAGLAVVAWTVASLRRARVLARAGVDGLICDDPARLVGVLRPGAAS